VDEKIRILVEQKKSIELEKTKLKESMERCEGEKKKVEDGAKNMITESKELIVKGLLSCTYHLLLKNNCTKASNV
jgi:hypothetical protein